MLCTAESCTVYSPPTPGLYSKGWSLRNREKFNLRHTAFFAPQFPVSGKYKLTKHLTPSRGAVRIWLADPSYTYYIPIDTNNWLLVTLITKVVKTPVGAGVPHLTSELLAEEEGASEEESAEAPTGFNEVPIGCA